MKTFEPGILSLELANGISSLGMTTEHQNGSTIAPQFMSPQGHSQIEMAIAVLLLDAENLQLDEQQEFFLSSLCQYSIRVKIAFAGWRQSKRNYDQELHERGYNLFHVPSGNDMADGKLITVGSSIKNYYPTTKEIFVCSSDKVTISLCTELRQQGLTVYRVAKQANGNLVIHNLDSRKDVICPAKSVPTGDLERKPDKTPIKNEQALEDEIVEIVRSLIGSNPNNFIPISKVDSQFYKEHKQSIKAALKQRKAVKKYTSFLQGCQKLDVQLKNKNWVVKLR